MTVPCGQCIGCRLERSRQWAVRCMHEASLHDDNSFITLTYDDESLPPFGSLLVEDFQLFMKRLRRRNSDVRIRFFHCGEYGAAGGRPHYHALLFGFDFADKVPWRESNGLPVWRSAALEALWPFGQSEIGTVTFESAAYVARYITKKVTGKGAEAYYQGIDYDTGEVGPIRPEYATMSRRPGIGSDWFAKFAGDVFPSDEVIVRGKATKPPRYYDNLFEVAEPEVAARVQAARRDNRSREDETPDRLSVREVCAKAKLTLYGDRL